MTKVKITRPTQKELKALGVEKWGIWESDVKKFDWEYDEEETIYVLEGKVRVLLEDGEEVVFGKGDLVTFPKGIRCTWDVKEKIKKRYTFKR